MVIIFSLLRNFLYLKQRVAGHSDTGLGGNDGGSSDVLGVEAIGEWEASTEATEGEETR